MSFNQSANIYDEACYRRYTVSNNKKISNYTIPPNHKASYNNRKSYFSSLSEPGLYLNDHDGQSTTRVVNNDSKLKNGVKGNQFTREQYSIPEDMNVFGRNSDEKWEKVNPDALSKLYNGKQAPTLSDRLITEHSFKRFTPMIPCLRKEMGGFYKLIPTNVIRGGQDTREVNKCVDYVASNEWKE